MRSPPERESYSLKAHSCEDAELGQGPPSSASPLRTLSLVTEEFINIKDR